MNQKFKAGKMADNLKAQCNHKNKPENRFCTQCGCRLVRIKQSGIARLTLLQGDRTNAAYYLLEKDCSIGRDLQNTVILSDSLISKQHAQISNLNGEYWIHDKKSKNGVYLNGKKITDRERLFNGCLLKMGTTILRFDTSTEQ